MSSSCFKIISCGNRDSIDNDDLESSPQSKGASDKRGWSFRKRSARHRVLSNTASSETPPSVNKGSPESADVDFQRQPNSTILEKPSTVQWTEEKPQLPTPVNTKLSETIVGEADDIKVDASQNESVVIIIQTAIRAFLAQKVLLKHKSIIKLQAAVRGHFVRRQAVGTLRCVQAIVKMQALVRARRACVLEQESSAIEKQIEKHEKNNDFTPTKKENSGSKPHFNYTSIEKLLSNKFAQQLLESTPRTKTINIKCDPLKSDSAWKWLERWMSVTSTENGPAVDTMQQEHKEIALVDSPEETVVPSERNCKAANLKPTIETSESDENLITYDADKLDVQACRPTSPSVSHNLDQPVQHNISEINSKEITSDSPTTQIIESDLSCKLEPNTIPVVTDTEGIQSLKRTAPEQPETDIEGVQSLKRTAPEQPETEGNKFSFGSRKASNPVFLAAQSKFEELSGATNSTKSVSSTNLDTEVESYIDDSSSFIDRASRKKESDLFENFVSDSSKLQHVDSDTSKVQFSECGTEISISSTLDSPNRSEVGANGFEQEGQFLNNRNEHPESKGNLEVEAKGDSTNLDSDLPHSDAVQPERYTSTTAANNDGVDSVMSVEIPQVEKKPNTDVSELQMEAETEEGHRYTSTTAANNDGVDSVMSVELPQVEKKPNTDVSELQMEAETEEGHQLCQSSPKASPRIHVTVAEPQGTPSNTDVFELQMEAETEKGHQVRKSSPKASPRVHITAPDPQGTPSSEVSVKSKRRRDDKSGSNHKLKSSSAAKKTPSNLNHDSGARSSTEQLPKDHKTAKRRNSIGSPKPDQVDQESRDSISSNSLPSYMQPTKSARAKALSNSSPRSSPDLQEKEVHIKKRHSLPGANGGHGSPQIQQTLSEAQQAAKGTGTQSPQERKWRR